MILSIDPGIRACGVALFDPKTKSLLRAALVKNADLSEPMPGIEALDESNEATIELGI